MPDSISYVSLYNLFFLWSEIFQCFEIFQYSEILQCFEILQYSKNLPVFCNIPVFLYFSLWWTFSEYAIDSVLAVLSVLFLSPIVFISSVWFNLFLLGFQLYLHDSAVFLTPECRMLQSCRIPGVLPDSLLQTLGQE